MVGLCDSGHGVRFGAELVRQKCGEITNLILLVICQLRKIDPIHCRVKNCDAVSRSQVDISRTGRDCCLGCSDVPMSWKEMHDLGEWGILNDIERSFAAGKDRSVR